MRTRVRAARRRSAVAKRFYLFRELFATPDPLAVFLALRLHHRRGRPTDESLVLETRRQRRELGIELSELAPQFSAFLAEVDQTAERHDHFAAVGQNRVCGAGARGL